MQQDFKSGDQEICVCGCSNLDRSTCDEAG